VRRVFSKLKSERRVYACCNLLRPHAGHVDTNEILRQNRTTGSFTVCLPGLLTDVSALVFVVMPPGTTDKTLAPTQPQSIRTMRRKNLHLAASSRTDGKALPLADGANQ